MYSLNPKLQGFRCIRCGAGYAIGDYPRGCEQCLADGFPASLSAYYAGPMIAADCSPRGLKRFSRQLPYLTFPSLGEGDTPAISSAFLADSLDLETLWIKYEGAGPTGSHKDRMSCLAVARAHEIGARTVVAASSGNAGASLAAYAGAAGLDCVVVTTSQISQTWRRAIEATGARVVTCQDPAERWHYVARAVRDQHWYPITNYLDPPVGSNCWGVEGYKTIAFELLEAAGPARLTAVVVPTARGDLLWGIFQGFQEMLASRLMQKLPQLFAVEPFPRLSKVLAGGDYRAHYPGRSQLTSIGGSTVTFQAVEAVRRSGGDAVVAPEGEVREDQKALAALGIYLELSSAATLTAVRRLRRSGLIAPGGHVALIGTSHGYKDALAAAA